MYARFLTASLYGLTGEETWAEVDSENGLPFISIVGLANQSVKEAKDRIHSAIVNCGFDFPARKITVNLTPANKKKEGSHYDLPIALGVLNSTGLMLLPETDEYYGGKTACFGELTLDGKLNPITGALPMIIGLRNAGVKAVILPKANLPEALLVKGIVIYPAENLKDVVNHITGLVKIVPVHPTGKAAAGEAAEIPDFSDIKGQELVKRAAQIAAAGMHGLLMVGPPGVGKSMVGKRIPGLLPPLNYEEQLEVTQVYSVAGELSEKRPMITQRPFRAPHHSASSASLIGSSFRPGEISLAHNGILFLDELPEFNVRALDMLRQPLEDGFIKISRSNFDYIYPADFMLVAAMNPCKCGYYRDPVKPCSCTETERRHYVGKVSGPLLDRIDIIVSLQRVLYDDMASDRKPADSQSLRQGVRTAFAMQEDRYRGTGIRCNAGLPTNLIEKYCALDGPCAKLMEDAFRRWDLSARSYHRILKVARTVADTEGTEKIEEKHLFEALSYRMPDKLLGV